MIVVLNNKSNFNKSEFEVYQKDLSNIRSKNKIILCPTFLNISEFNLNNISLGSQNVSTTNDGAYTGEVSARQLKSYNVKYSIVGHSERRTKETEEEINQKIKILLENDIIPILCIGENKEEHHLNETSKKIEHQLITAIKNISNDNCKKIIIAYEPIWSIGTGIIPSTEEIDEAVDIIRKRLPNNDILYGGSVNENNINYLKKCKQINGYLLGGISLKPDKLKQILDKI